MMSWPWISMSSRVGPRLVVVVVAVVAIVRGWSSTSHHRVPIAAAEITVNVFHGQGTISNNLEFRLLQIHIASRHFTFCTFRFVLKHPRFQQIMLPSRLVIVSRRTLGKIRVLRDY
uniref:Uncharacterized protein n=1 Tax=Cyclophora tenuis TaxID=216820 RepID=A0A7S1GR19_CYCTE